MANLLHCLIVQKFLSRKTDQWFLSSCVLFWCRFVRYQASASVKSLQLHTVYLNCFAKLDKSLFWTDRTCNFNCKMLSIEKRNGPFNFVIFPIAFPYTVTFSRKPCRNTVYPLMLCINYKLRFWSLLTELKWREATFWNDVFVAVAVVVA